MPVDGPPESRCKVKGGVKVHVAVNVKVLVKVIVEDNVEDPRNQLLPRVALVFCSGID
jgi:hypothetical protein